VISGKKIVSKPPFNEDDGRKNLEIETSEFSLLKRRS